MAILTDEEKKSRVWYGKIDNVRDIDEKVGVIKEILQSKSHGEIDILDAIDSLPQDDMEDARKYSEFLEFIRNDYNKIIEEYEEYLKENE